MEKVTKLINDVIIREGGYSNHPNDRGGPTRWGITQQVAREHGYTDDMKRLPREEAVEIYRQIYWLRPRFDSIAERAPLLAAELFDTAVNMGTGRSIRFLQRSLNALQREGSDDLLQLDGTIGPHSLRVLDLFLTKRGHQGERVLARAVDSLQGAKYIRLAESRPANRSFLFGWLAHRVGLE